MTKTDKIFRKNKNLILLAIIFVCFGIILVPFGNIIGASILTAYFTYPLYKKLGTKLNSFFAMFITWIIVITILIMPIGIIGAIGVYQSKTVINKIQNSQVISKEKIEKLKDKKYLGGILEYMEENEEDFKEVEAYIGQKAAEFGKIFLVKAGSIVKAIPMYIIMFILYVFITSSLLVNGQKIIKILRGLVPFEGKIFDTYIEKIKYMTNGIMKGNFIVAGIQAVTTTLSFILAGIPYAGIVFIVSFILYIPMIGTVILYIPATIYLIVKGQYLAAILIFLWNSVAVANIDNILRGKFVPEEARVNNTLIFISILSGILIFGVMGLLYGPILAIIGLTSIKMYMELKNTKN